MSIVLGIVSRNLRLFFRDRLNVFFSLLSGLILFVLYTLFLARLQVDGLSQTLPNATESQIAAFVDSWMLSGIVLLTTVTSGIGALSTLVDDRATRRFADFLVAPIRRTHLVLGYLVSSVIVARFHRPRRLRGLVPAAPPLHRGCAADGDGGRRRGIRFAPRLLRYRPVRRVGAGGGVGCRRRAHRRRRRVHGAVRGPHSLAPALTHDSARHPPVMRPASVRGAARTMDPS